MGGRRGKRTPTYNPVNTFFWAGMLLCFTVGITCGGIHDSWLAGDYAWTTVFLAGSFGCIGLYLWVVRSWWVWHNLSEDDRTLCADVNCLREHTYDPGQHDW